MFLCPNLLCSVQKTNVCFVVVFLVKLTLVKGNDCNHPDSSAGSVHCRTTSAQRGHDTAVFPAEEMSCDFQSDLCLYRQKCTDPGLSGWTAANGTVVIKRAGTGCGNGRAFSVLESPWFKFNSMSCIHFTFSRKRAVKLSVYFAMCGGPTQMVKTNGDTVWITTFPLTGRLLLRAEAGCGFNTNTHLELSAITVNTTSFCDQDNEFVVNSQSIIVLPTPDQVTPPASTLPVPEKHPSTPTSVSTLPTTESNPGTLHQTTTSVSTRSTSTDLAEKLSSSTTPVPMLPNLTGIQRSSLASSRPTTVRTTTACPDTTTASSFAPGSSKLTVLTTQSTSSLTSDHHLWNWNTSNYDGKGNGGPDDNSTNINVIAWASATAVVVIVAAVVIIFVCKGQHKKRSTVHNSSRDTELEKEGEPTNDTLIPSLPPLSVHYYHTQCNFPVCPISGTTTTTAHEADKNPYPIATSSDGTTRKKRTSLDEDAYNPVLSHRVLTISDPSDRGNSFDEDTDSHFNSRHTSDRAIAQGQTGDCQIVPKDDCSFCCTAESKTSPPPSPPPPPPYDSGGVYAHVHKKGGKVKKSWLATGSNPVKEIYAQVQKNGDKMKTISPAAQPIPVNEMYVQFNKKSTTTEFSLTADSSHDTVDTIGSKKSGTESKQRQPGENDNTTIVSFENSPSRAKKAWEETLDTYSGFGEVPSPDNVSWKTMVSSQN